MSMVHGAMEKSSVPSEMVRPCATLAVAPTARLNGTSTAITELNVRLNTIREAHELPGPLMQALFRATLAEHAEPARGESIYTRLHLNSNN